MLKKETQYSLFFFTLLLIAGAVIYWPSLNAPWYYDDINNIVENPAIRDLPQALKNIFSHRGLAYFSFAVNYELGGLNPYGFHIFNILIHVFASFFAFLIFKNIFPKKQWLAFIGSLIFLAHPVQTQAVTYIVQRMASMSALFFLAAVYFFIRARIEKQGKSENRNDSTKKAYLNYVISLVMAVFAGMSKENAATLPAILIAIDLVIFRETRYFRDKKFLSIIPFLIPSFFLVFQQFSIAESTLNNIQFKYFYFESDRGDPQFSFLDPAEIRWQWLFTQFIIIWKYILLFVFPYDQTLDYGYPLVKNLFNIRSIFGLAGIIAVIAWAFRFHRTQPVAACGILWFFITISLEASIFPLDPMYEHRLYLPIVGLILIFLEGLKRLPSQTLLNSFSLLVVVVLAVVTFNRNLLWSDPIRFWTDNVAKSPYNFRPKMHLALALSDVGRYREALALAKEATELNPSPKHYSNLGMLYAETGRLAKAEETYKYLVKAAPGHAEYHLNLSIIQGRMGKFAGALKSARQAATLDADNSRILTNLGIAHARLGQKSKAVQTLRRALTLQPGNALAGRTLAQILEKK